VRRISLVVPAADVGARLDSFIAESGGISRGLARRVLALGGVFVEGHRCKIASRPLRGGQRVEVSFDDAEVRAPPLPLEPGRLLHADADLVAVDKPAGVPSQATRTSDRGTLAELAAALVGAPLMVVHRLDRGTSGVTVLARTPRAAASLSEAFRTGAAHKTYLALCVRPPEPPAGRIDAALGPGSRPGTHAVSPTGAPAATRYRTLGHGRAALVEAQPETGRTHQVRVHLAHLGAPLLGDTRYGGPAEVAGLAIARPMLHALRLEIPHPTSGDTLILEAPLPEDFRAFEEQLLDDPGV
jgi:23S rRNA pseudouridine1911/1915/1917 synthase